MNNVGDNDSPDLLSGISETDAFRCLLDELQEDLPSKVARMRYLADLGNDLGSQGTMIFGGSASTNAWIEARISFVHGNFVAVVLLCQALAENLLAAFLHAGLVADDLPHRIAFRDTLRRCRKREIISGQDQNDLIQLMNLRNPLSHFRAVDDASNVDRRSIRVGLHSQTLIERDARFAIGLAVRLLAKRQFRID